MIWTYAFINPSILSFPIEPFPVLNSIHAHSIQQFTKEKSSDAVLKQPLLELKKGIPGSKHVLTIIKINILLIIPIFILIM